MKILICGDRAWTNVRKIEAYLRRVQQTTGLIGSEITIIHGACRGADSVAGDIAKSLGMAVVPFPAEWNGLKKAAGPIRNQKMLDEHPDLVVAFHAKLKTSKGTLDCIMEANRRGVRVEIIP